jgi:hypothetical protein
MELGIALKSRTSIPDSQAMSGPRSNAKLRSARAASSGPVGEQSERLGVAWGSV